jgi:hypothetical protein
MADQGHTAGGQPRPLQMGAKGAYIVRLLMVGDSSCGKTSLVLRFDQNVFSTKFVTTIGVDYRDKMVKVRLPSFLREYEGKKYLFSEQVSFVLMLLLFFSYQFSFSSTFLAHLTRRSRVLLCVYSYGTLLDKKDSDH